MPMIEDLAAVRARQSHGDVALRALEARGRERKAHMAAEGVDVSGYCWGVQLTHTDGVSQCSIEARCQQRGGRHPTRSPCHVLDPCPVCDGG
jgi:hypothetical protein